jgi:hypothetical protein
MEQDNLMKERVEVERLDRNTKAWTKIDAKDWCPEFPQLTIEDLLGITLGPYQLTLVKHYAKLHSRKKARFEIIVNNEVPGVVRARIHSRFSGSSEHQVWVSFNPDLTGIDAVTGYFCKCKQGSRTVGCCAHICCILWFLSHARHFEDQEEPVRKKRRGERCLPIKDAKSELKARSSAVHGEGETSDSSSGDED